MSHIGSPSLSHGLYIQQTSVLKEKFKKDAIIASKGKISEMFIHI
jgi:hypothetical protein